MILDLRQLKKTGKDEESFFFEYSPSDTLTEIPNTQIVSPIKVSGRIALTGDHSAFVEGEAVFVLSGECTKCLKDTSREFVCEFGEECFPDNDGGYSVVNDKIDLSRIVDDAVIVDMPTAFLCSEDCKGICSGCGVNLNDGQCKCDK